MKNNEITCENARKMSEYKFTEEYSKKDILNYKNVPETQVGNVLAVLEFGNVDIELIVNEDSNEGYIAEYHIFIKVDEDEIDSIWEEVEILTFEPKEYSEENMFNILIEYIKENNLSWSELNN